MPPRVDNTQQQAQEPSQNPNSVYYLSNNDVTTSKLVTTVFDGNAYNDWRHAMMIALSARNKLCFVDGSLPQPAANSPNLKLWLRCNDLLKPYNRLHCLPVTTNMTEITNVSEYEKLAKQKLPKMIYDYYASGAEDQWTLEENRNAFSRILFRPRILIDVSHTDITTTVLGFNISMPIMIAPSAMQKMAHPEGEFATARAASAYGTIMTLSTMATSSVDEVASAGHGIRFFQLYMMRDRRVVTQLVKRAEKAGFKAIVLTVDTPRVGRREADIKNRFTLPRHLTLENFEGLDLGKIDRTSDPGLVSYFTSQVDRSLSWKGLTWLQTITKLPILLKGLLTAEDARLAVQAGAAGIIVSNHGARQLDYVPATIMALEEIVNAVQRRIPVFLDGGIRRGTDVFKALALGASGIFIGRPVVYSLAVDGEAGVRKVLEMLRDEFELTMALSGCRTIEEITRNHVMTEWDTPRFSSKL